MHIHIWKRENSCLSAICFGWMAALLLTLPAISVAQQAAVGEYPIPTASSFPAGVAAGPDGAVWFTESDKIGRMTPAGCFTEYPVPTVDSGPWGITAGPDGALWFTEEFGNNIGRITTTGVVTAEYPVSSGGPYGITTGPDKALWFTEPDANNIGRITTAGVVTEYPVLTAGGRPYGITTGPDGALWFTEFNGNKIGRITTDGAVTEYQVPTAGSDPSEITDGPDVALWFTEGNCDNIGRITTAGTITEYPVPAASFPYGITAGPDAALWFTGAYDIGRITTDGVVTEYPVPIAGSYPLEITAGPDGALWFTEFDGNKIGEVVFVTAGLSVSPATGSYRTNLTFTGSAFTPNERVEVYTSGVGSSMLAGATADADGSLTATSLAPLSEYGPRLFLAVGQTSRKLGAANFSVIPRLILTPNSGTMGSTVTARGLGFGSFETVKVYWQTPPTLLGTVTTDVNGAFIGSAALAFTVPPGAPLGVNMVGGKGQTTGAIGVAFVTLQNEQNSLR
jgi:streptogramin lyase